MSSEPLFYHALQVNEEKCHGCTICIFKCPTGAIRIRNGKAAIHANWCIDCGECFMYCPSKAIYVEEDDFSRIYEFKHRVALVPALFLGQFSKKKDVEEINSAIYTLGFTHIYPVEIAVDSIHREMKRQLEEAEERPVISSFCPATNRLIQIKYPDLTEHILPIKSPVNGAALLVKEDLTNRGLNPDDIGIFYVTPCAAKIAEIKGHHESERLINGVINMDTLYNKVNQILLKHTPIIESEEQRHVPRLTACQMCWSLTGGEADRFEGRTLAIDEIHNVIEFIERMESTSDVQNVDFLALRACDRSCVGGALTPANRFLASERLSKRAEKINHTKIKNDFPSTIAEERLEKEIGIEPLQPMAKLNYVGGITDVLKQMERVRELMCYLPGIDCGACGSPGCKALAEDIVRGEAQLSSCLFLQRDLVHKGKLPGERASALVEKVWGKDRLEKDCYKRGATMEGKPRTEK